jgi:hypothetical protein
MKTTVYLTKFNLGYYAKKQPNYDWSYTNDLKLAARYKSTKSAKERGEWGLGLSGIHGTPAPTSYEIVVCEVEVEETITVIS